MNARDDALQQEIKAARSDARLRATFAVAAAFVVALLLSTLIYSVQASIDSQVAAEAATAQSVTNTHLLERLAANSAANALLLRQVDVSDKNRRADLQDLLDTIYGPGRVKLGEPVPAGVRPLN